MTTLIPNRFLFDFEFPLRYRAKPPVINGDVSHWLEVEMLPKLGEIDGKDDFADAWACWNESGLYFAWRVIGKKQPLSCNLAGYWKGDNVRLCTDMRDARSIKRATRTCQQFYFLPTGGGPDKNLPIAGSAKIKRAREDAPAVDRREISIASKVTKTGYSLEVFLPAECLSGFDPVEHPRIGLYHIIEDREHGQQFPTVGDDLFWQVDPSTWPTAVLTK